MSLPPRIRRQLSRFKGTVIQQLNRVRSVEAIFDSIYRHHGWGDGQSVSGTGSNLEQTRYIRSQLPELFRRYNVRTVLDIPCGDFNWMRHVKIDGIRYHGADVVEAIIAMNRKFYTTPQISFSVIDLTRGPLPQVDLVFCRDCLVHFSYRHIYRALETIVASSSTFLLTTTFPSQGNTDIVTGSWRPLNLSAEPFCFPEPLTLINEGYHGPDSGVADKSLALWRIADLQNMLP